MTEEHGGRRCKYCWHPADSTESSVQAHNPGCPQTPITGTEEAEWKAGADYGFRDEHIPTWRYRYYSPSFILGYRVGSAEIEALVEDHLERRNNNCY